MIEVNQGDSRSILLRVRNSTGVDIDLSGSSVHVTLFDNFNSMIKSFCSKNNTLYYLNNLIVIYLNSEETRMLDPGVLHIEVRACKNGNSSSVQIKKVIRINNRVEHGC